MNLSEKSVRKPVSTLMGVLAVLMVGMVVLPRLPIDFLPNIERNTISVSTRYEGAGPQEIERLITEPIERAVSTVNNVKHINSTSREGSSNVRIEFAWGTDMNESMNSVRDKVSVAKRSLPDDADDPVISKFDFNMMPILQLTITGNMPTVDLKDYVENELRYRLEQIEGVASVDVSGGETREIHVFVDQAKLASLNIPIDSVVAALQRENKDTPGGFVKQGDTEFLIRNRGEFTNIKSIQNVLVTYQGNSPIYVKDVAGVKEGIAEKRSDTRLMGRKGVMISIRKQSGENTVKVADRVKARIAEIEKALPPGVVIKTMMDNSTMIRDSIAELKRSAIIGGLLAIFVIFVFLMNIRSTLIIFVSIPFSVVSTFIFLYFTGLTLNIMSLGGLALGVGRIVDDSIVVLENIYRHRMLGENRIEAAVKGAGEVSMAVTASTATTICVFLPLVLVSGMSGIFFKELGITVTISLISSLIVSLTLIPMLSSRFLKIKPGRKGAKSVYDHGIYKFYGNLLGFALRHKAAAMLFVVVLFVGGMLLLRGKIGSEYLPQVDEGQISVRFELPVGTKLGITQREMLKLEKVIMSSVKEISNMNSQAGSGGGGYGGGASGVNAGSFNIILVPSDMREKSTTQIANELQEKLMGATKGKVWVTESGSIMQRVMGGGESRLELDIRGHDMAPADALALKVSDIVSSTRGASNPRISRTPGMPEMNIVVDREKAAMLGFNPSYVGDVVKANVDGIVATRLRRGSDEIDIRVRQRPEDIKSLEAVGNILLSSPGSPPVPLRSLVKLVKNTGPVQIQRLDQERIVTINASYTGEVSPGDVNAEIEKRIKEISLPAGFSIDFAGEEVDRQESASSLNLAFILAIALVFMVMATQFESLLHPFIIMFAVPLSLLGVMISLYITKTNFSLMANLGSIMLAGIVVTNGIVLIDFVNQLRRKGASVDEAVVQAGRLRLRPIVMTATATVLGLIPLALGIGRGSEMQAPLARVVIGGMIVATSLTLLFVPVLYAAIEGFLERRRTGSTQPEQQ
jgi:hydrophobic/amphiphilic exporter-1 (mainly G- bacteria), HAE1 family